MSLNHKIHSSRRRSWVELQVMSNFSFLRGASHPEELISEASQSGYHAVALTDLNTVGGIVRAHAAAEITGIRFITGAQISLLESFEPNVEPEGPYLQVLVYPTTRDGYGALCSILTLGKRRAAKGACLLSIEDFLTAQKDLLCILIPPFFDEISHRKLSFGDFGKYCRLFRESLRKDYLSIAITRNYDHHTPSIFEQIKREAGIISVPLVAANNVYYHSPSRKPLQDVLSCIREKCSVHEAGFRLLKNSCRHLKDPSFIKHIYRDEPEAVTRTLTIEEMTRGFSLNLLKYEYPDEICPENRAPLEYLRELTLQGAQDRYPEGLTDRVRSLLEDELSLIHELQYEKYFLTCHDIVRFARSRGILCQGRGAAANSAVCFCLGITSVDPEKIDLLFARFISRERNEPPDIDLDFEHERREEVIQYIYAKYGRHRAGLTAEVITYRHRSAVRDTGKALGLPLETVDRLAKGIHRWASCELRDDFIRGLGLDVGDATIHNTLLLSREMLGFPRHLSQHVGGFIISLRPLSETVPILNASMPDRTIIEWDKDDIERLGMLKIDVLGLGMLTCIRKALGYINEKQRKNGECSLELHTIPAEDPAVYDMLCESDSTGVFQVESRAQMSMLPRLKPRCFYDLVIEVAIVRPGPIHGNMVHPFLRRRSGTESVEFPDDEVRAILGKTLGVPLFQEQAMRLAIVLADFSPGEAEQLRRAMAAWKKNKALIESFQKRIVTGMGRKGYSREFAETCVHQIKGFSEYGFPESHAASFAILVYASAWLKRHYPVEFSAALLNSQPMGFYAPSQIVRDLQAHGGNVLPVDINASAWDCSIEITGEHESSLRLGMRLIRSMHREQGFAIENLIKQYGPVRSIRELWLRAYEENIPIRRFTLIHLAEADAFLSLGLSRRDAIWEIRGLPWHILPLDLLHQTEVVRTKSNFRREPFDSLSLAQGSTRLGRKSGLPRAGPTGPSRVETVKVELRSPSLQESMFQDYSVMGLSLKAHPVFFIRAELTRRRALTASRLHELKKGEGRVRVSAGGIATVRQRPGSAKGVVFMTLEDETGTFNLIIRPKIFERYSSLILAARCFLAHGTLEKIGSLPYVNVQHLESLDDELFRTKGAGIPSKSYSY